MDFFNNMNYELFYFFNNLNYNKKSWTSHMVKTFNLRKIVMAHYFTLKFWVSSLKKITFKILQKYKNYQSMKHIFTNQFYGWIFVNKSYWINALFNDYYNDEYHQKPNLKIDQQKSIFFNNQKFSFKLLRLTFE